MTKCNHRRCRGGPCRAIPPEDLKPEAEDLELAEQLVREGWKSTSSKYRTVAKFRTPPPPAAEMLRPELVNTPQGKRLAELWDRHRHSLGLRQEWDDVEERELTLKQFRAFKLKGGLPG